MNNDINNVLSNLEIYLADKTLPSKTGFEEQWLVLAQVLGEHFQTFGAYPSKQDIAFYQEMHTDIYIHRHD